MRFWGAAERVAKDVAEAKITYRPAEKALFGSMAHADIEGARLSRSAERFNAEHIIKRDATKQARKGKNISKMVAGGTVGVAALSTFRNRSGRAADKVMGRPTGPYGY